MEGLSRRAAKRSVQRSTEAIHLVLGTAPRGNLLHKSVVACIDIWAKNCSRTGIVGVLGSILPSGALLWIHGEKTWTNPVSKRDFEDLPHSDAGRCDDRLVHGSNSALNP